jgi:SpoVK/Ycf46/Vps4 family AAA+-type ATPase
MARSDLVKALLRSYTTGDDRTFRSTAEELILDERRKRHDLLANELEAILDEPGPTRRPLQVSALRPLPKGRDDLDLLDIIQPRASLHDVILDPDTAAVVDGLLDEFRQRGALHAHGLEPRSTLLFVGPPGCGKSLTAEALTGELGLGLARVRLSTVVSSFLGETAKNLEQIFAFLRTGSWVLLFDEFDMLANERGDRVDHGEVRRIVTALLQLVEDAHTDSLVIATTNHPHLLDTALWRRFDEIVAFEAPDRAQRVAMLEMKLRTVRHDLALSSIADRLDGYTHADIERVCEDAMRLMVRAPDRVVTQRHLDYGIERQEARRQTILGSQG